MARSIGYNPDEVLITIMHIFWRQGYEATRIQDIVKETGLKPGSLYHLYGNKEGIFKASLEKYSSIYIEKIEKIFSQASYTLQNIETFLNEIVIVNISNQSTNGCLLVKTLLTIPHEDIKIQKYVNTFFESLEVLLYRAIQTAVNKGETTVNPAMFSKFIITTVYGAHVYYKTSRDINALKGSINLIIEQLNYKKTEPTK